MSSSSNLFDDVRALYNDAIRQHGRHPAHGTRLTEFDGQARGDNPMCGDRVQVFVRREGGLVAEAGFEARGCEVSIASADLMCDIVVGVAAGHIPAMMEQVAALARTGECQACDNRLMAFSAVHEFSSRARCVTLPWTALVAALAQGESR